MSGEPGAARAAPAARFESESTEASAIEVVDPRSTLGRRTFIAGAAGAVVGASTLGSAAHAVEPGASFFRAESPRRLCDTRLGTGFVRLDGNTIRVKVAGNGSISTVAVAAVLTVTAVNLRGGGNWVAAYPAGGAFSGTSNLNCAFFDHRVANLVTVKLGAGGAATRGWVEIKTLGPAEVIVDVAGVYLPTVAPVREGRFVAVDPVRRPVDTRETGAPKPGAGAVVRVNLNGIVPSDALAVVANLTGVEASGRGFLTAYPRGGVRPDTSNLNLQPGETRAVGIMTKLGFTDGITGIDVYTLRGAHVVVDVAGYITGPSAPLSDAGLFVPINPVRLLDTRNDKRRLWPGWTRASKLPAPVNTKSQAVAMNLTVTRTMNRGFFTMLGAQTLRRVVSNLNATGPGQTIANHAVVRSSTAGIECFSQKGAHIIFDLTGWFTGAPAAATQPVPLNPPPPAAPLPWTLNVPKMGLVNGVFAGSPNPIVDSGNTWHWTGTGLVGQATNIAVFGHRTEAGGPYRYQHNLRAGDLLYVTTPDNRLYTYRMTAEYLTSKFSSDILAATRRIGGETFALVACTKLNRLPTSLEYRMVSIFALVEWADLG